MATRDDYPGCWSCRPLCLCLHFAHFPFKPNGSSLYTLAGHFVRHACQVMQVWSRLSEHLLQSRDAESFSEVTTHWILKQMGYSYMSIPL